MALHAVVPAAGIGNRMQSSLPKQYLPLHGRTVLAHSLARLTSLSALKTVMVAVAAGDPWWPEVYSGLDDSGNGHIAERVAEEATSGVTRGITRGAAGRVQSCVGGHDRWQSVLNALDALAQTASSSDWVLVHDAVRPCVRVADIERLLSAVQDAGASGGLLAMPVSDTIKRAGVDNSTGWSKVEATVDRQRLWAACTPQMFRLGELRDCLRRAAAANVALTDEASAMEWGGHAPLLVPCARDNIKITFPADLALAEFIIKSGVTTDP